MSSLPEVLILGHSFVKRLFFDLQRGFDPRAHSDFRLKDRAHVRMFGVGGRTVQKLLKHDLHVLSESSTDIVILEIGTNDLSDDDPSLVAAAIEVLVRLLHDRFKVKVICVCLVIPRRAPCAFNDKVAEFNQEIRVLLDPLTFVFCWIHKGFYNHSRQLLLSDGVHVDPLGQYLLYRSYRGAILKALAFPLH
jgi:lysophospholipase L1-like esterase